MSLSALQTRLEKAAVDNGFDRELLRQEAWLGFASTRCPLEMWLTVGAAGELFVALSMANVADALTRDARRVEGPIGPVGAAATLEVAELPALHRLLRRAFQLSRSLPDALLHVFESKVAELVPRTTEVRRLVLQRIGQDVFRAGLLDYWEGRCAITGLNVAEMLRASHIKPWADCATDAERLDVFNGLLLAAQIDAAFDAALITLSDDGAVIVSPRLTHVQRALLGWDLSLRVARLTDAHRRYLKWHRRLFDERR